MLLTFGESTSQWDIPPPVLTKSRTSYHVVFMLSTVGKVGIVRFFYIFLFIDIQVYKIFTSRLIVLEIEHI